MLSHKVLANEVSPLVRGTERAHTFLYLSLRDHTFLKESVRVSVVGVKAHTFLKECVRFLTFLKGSARAHTFLTLAHNVLKKNKL